MTTTPILEQIEYIKFHELQTDNPINEKLNAVLDDPDSIHYMENIIEAIMYTRDINGGRGLRDLTYTYLFTLQQKFAMKAVFTLYMIVEQKIGSWRDVRSYCEFVAKHSTNYSIIKPIIGLYNNQLIKDNQIWKETIKAWDPATSPRPVARDYISYAAKWVPRESKGRKWLFNILVSMWVYMNDDYKTIMTSAKTQEAISAAERKCKMMYRKMISNLNKELDTLEIKQCANEWSEINPHQLTTSQLYHGKETFLKKCKWDAFYKEKLALITEKKYSYDVPIWKLVKHIVRLSKQDDKTEELDAMNLHWPAYIEHKFENHTDYYISMVDVSESMYENGSKPLYDAIGLGCIIASKSKFGPQVIVLGNKPEMVDLANCTFSEMVDRMISTPLHRSTSCITEGFQLILDAVLASGMTPEEVDCLKIKVLSNNIHSIDYSTVSESWSNKGFRLPNII